MRLLVKAGHDRTLALEGETHVLLFRYIKNISKCAMELVRLETFNRKGYRILSKHKPLGFLGMISMGKNIFLCIITGRIEVASPTTGQRINRIYDVEFHCLTSGTWDFIELNSNGYPITGEDDNIPGAYSTHLEQNPCYELRKILTDGSFYYSTDFDLTSTLQGRGVETSQRLSLDRFHMDYMWNAFMMKEIIHFRNNLDDEPKQALDENRFLTTVIRGFAQSVRAVIGAKTALLTVISKQSWKRTGTRFNVRGVDDNGNVANFVETETILNDGVHIFAYTQIRGSIPLFWEQDTALVSPKVQITRSFDASQPIFEKHFANLNGKYGPIHIVNLLSKTKSSEVELSRAYKEHYKALKEKKPDSVYFTDFDFHQETSKTYADADRVLKSLQSSLENFGYFCYDINNKETIMEQQGVFRTNCLDCLDRTNVVQQVISRAAVAFYLSDFNKGRTQRTSMKEYSSPYASNNSRISMESSPIFSKHSVIWADHGDQISQIYTGTNALKSSFSRKGKMGLAGALSDATKSLSRIYINNFVDKGKQVVIDTLLGKNTDQMPVLIFDPVTEWLSEKMLKVESQYTIYQDISIFVGTFNLSGTTSNKDLSHWLFPQETTVVEPDIYVIGFQEVIELNASSMLKNDGSAGQYWKRRTTETLNDKNGTNYVLLRSEYMSSVLLLFYVRDDKLKFVTQVEGKSKKTGLGGMTANKGSVAITFKYGSTSFCIFNSHLASGSTNTEERFNDFLTSWNGLRFSRNRLIRHHDNVIWLGDLNYRVSLSNEEARLIIDRGQMSKLLQYDQLSYELKRHPELQDFTELPIQFPPTYKFDRNSDRYDSSEKQRVPSWTDRILYQGKQISQLCYHYISDIKFSDHRPVYGTFSAKVKIVNSTRKHTLTKHFLQEYKSTAENSSANIIELNVDTGGNSLDSDALSSSSSSIPTLIDLQMPSEEPKNSSKPVVKSANGSLRTRRKVPPPFASGSRESDVLNRDGTRIMPDNIGIPSNQILGRTDSQQPPSSQSSSPALGAFAVMKPTRSRSGSPAAPSLPPRSSTASSFDSSNKLVTRPVPPAPRKISVSSQQSIIRDTIKPLRSMSDLAPQMTLTNSSVLKSTKENHKVPPIVPSKPKRLDMMFSDNEMKTTPSNASASIKSEDGAGSNPWAPMTPTRKR